jgi:hypothetical protein
LAELNEFMRYARVKVHNVSLVDYFGSQAQHRHMIPFPYEPGDGFHIHDLDKSLDFGVVPLSEMYCKMLNANGVIPITRKHWLDHEKFTYGGYKIHGLPTHLCDRAGVQPVVVGIDRLDPASFGQSSTWFCGRVIVGAEQLGSIKGMSGGPIYGFTKVDGQLAYRVVALQSGWLPDSRIAFGCQIHCFAEALREEIVSIDEQAQSAASAHE